MSSPCQSAIFIMSMLAVGSCMGNDNGLCNDSQCHSAKGSGELLMVLQGSTDEASLLHVHTKETIVGKQQKVKSKQSQYYAKTSTGANHSGKAGASSGSENCLEFGETSHGKCCGTACIGPDENTKYSWCYEKDSGSWDYCVSQKLREAREELIVDDESGEKSKDYDITSRGEVCVPFPNGCKYDGADYQWCYTGPGMVSWDYCVKEGAKPRADPCEVFGETTHGKCCANECVFKKKMQGGYSWCYDKDSGKEDYCASQKGKASGGQTCNMESCGYHGGDYQWCPYGLTWDYCVKSVTTPWAGSDPCVDFGKTTHGKCCGGKCTNFGPGGARLKDDLTSYLWCYESDSAGWDYCVPENGKTPYGLQCKSGSSCDNHGKDYQWCEVKERDPNGDGKDNPWFATWDYCVKGVTTDR